MVSLDFHFAVIGWRVITRIALRIVAPGVIRVKRLNHDYPSSYDLPAAAPGAALRRNPLTSKTAKLEKNHAFLDALSSDLLSLSPIKHASQQISSASRHPY
jgi:hypothetical protein